jgi:peptide/nickel transport system permease protein
LSGTPFCFARNRYEPGLCLTIVVYGINMFGDAIRDLLDPRLRGGGGRYGASKKRA